MTTMTLTDGTTVTLSPDQQQAREAVLDALLTTRLPEATLAGAAGSGKTTLMRALIADLRAAGKHVVLLAPTGKAARRLSEVCGENASTIHKPLYAEVSSRIRATAKEKAAYEVLRKASAEAWAAFRAGDGSGDHPPILTAFGDWVRDQRAAKRQDVEEDLTFSDPRAMGTNNTVLVVDEASMVGMRLANDLRGQLHGAQVLWVGDREQLPPVKDQWGCDWSRPVGLLTQVHRQAQGSPIIKLATAIRTGADWNRIDPVKPVYRDQCPPDRVAQWLAEQHTEDADSVCLTYTNKKRNLINDLTRAKLGYSQETLCVGERVLVTSNHYNTGLCNGEVKIVTDMRLRKGLLDVDVYELRLRGVTNDAGVERWIPYEPKALAAGQRPRARGCLSIDYGYCLSIHKSQGSQWHTVGIIHDGACWWLNRERPDEYRRLIYTAVTRASDRLLVFDQ